MIVSRWACGVRRHWVKSVLMYKILNEQSAPSLREKFIKIKDLNREYNLRSNDTDPKPKTNCLNSFSAWSIKRMPCTEYGCFVHIFGSVNAM